MPSYKLTYFDVTARAEESYLLFALAKQDFEKRIVTQDEWKDLKSKTPMGGLPLLEVDGVMISQSMAIARFLARQFGYAGKTDFEAAQVDMVIDSITDVMDGAVKIMSVPEDKKEEATKKYVEETVPAGLKVLEKLLGGNKWFVGDSITWADVRYYAIFTLVLPGFGIPIPVDKFPNSKKLCDRVAEVPEIKEYLKNKGK